MSVEILNIIDGEEIREKRPVWASVSGEDVVRVWLEISKNENRKVRQGWVRTGRIIFAAPYSFTLDPAKLDEGLHCLRVGAEDFWGNIGYSRSLKVSVKK